MQVCGRYYIEIAEEEMRDIIRVVNSNLNKMAAHAQMKTGEIFPTDIVPIQTQNSIQLMKWGFAKYDGKGQIINARSETALEKPMFRKGMLEHRCLVPASNYFEWQKAGTKKIKHAFRLPDSPVLYMAGIYRMEKDSPLPTFIILTRDASPAVEPIHDRMPVIIPRPLMQSWLQEDAGAMQQALKDVSVEIA